MGYVRRVQNDVWGWHIQETERRAIMYRTPAAVLATKQTGHGDTNTNTSTSQVRVWPRLTHTVPRPRTFSKHCVCVQHLECFCCLDKSFQQKILLRDTQSYPASRLNPHFLLSLSDTHTRARYLNPNSSTKHKYWAELQLVPCSSIYKRFPNNVIGLG